VISTGLRNEKECRGDHVYGTVGILVFEVRIAVDASEGEVGAVDFDVDVEDSPGDGDTIWNRRAKRRNWKTRYSDSEYVTRAEVTKTNWQHALDFGVTDMASLSLAERAVLRSPVFSEFFGNFELTLMNERQMPTHLKNNPVTQDLVRYPAEGVRMNLSQHKQRTRDQAQVDLRYHKLEEVAPTLILCSMDIVADPPPNVGGDNDEYSWLYKYIQRPRKGGIRIHREVLLVLSILLKTWWYSCNGTIVGNCKK